MSATTQTEGEQPTCHGAVTCSIAGIDVRAPAFVCSVKSVLVHCSATFLAASGKRQVWVSQLDQLTMLQKHVPAARHCALQDTEAVQFTANKSFDDENMHAYKGCATAAGQDMDCCRKSSNAS